MAFRHSSLSSGKESAYNAGDMGSSLGWKDPLEKGKATQSSILAWRIPCTIQSMRSQRVRHRTGLSDFHFHFPKYHVKQFDDLRVIILDSEPLSLNLPLPSY